jgi:hypothetical protein
VGAVDSSQFSPQSWKELLIAHSVKGTRRTTIWRDEEFKKFLRDYDLIGMSQVQVVSLLGSPDRKVGYLLHAGGDTLLDVEIQYESDRVKQRRFKGFSKSDVGPWQTTNVLWEADGMVFKVRQDDLLSAESLVGLEGKSHKLNVCIPTGTKSLLVHNSFCKLLKSRD